MPVVVEVPVHIPVDIPVDIPVKEILVAAPPVNNAYTLVVVF